MSHQDRKSREQIVVNHQVLREVIAWILPPSLFVGMHVRQGSTWKPRMLAAEALFWVTSDRTTLTDRFQDTRKIIKRVFRGQAEPGKTYRGFMKMLDKWHAQLLLRVVWELRLRMRQELADQFQIAGFTVFAGTAAVCKRRGHNRTNRRIPYNENPNATRRRNRSGANHNRPPNGKPKPPNVEK